MNELRSFWGSKKLIKFRLECKMYCESKGGNSTEEDYKSTLAFILLEEILVRGKV